MEIVNYLNKKLANCEIGIAINLLLAAARLGSKVENLWKDSRLNPSIKDMLFFSRLEIRYECGCTEPARMEQLRPPYAEEGVEYPTYSVGHSLRDYLRNHPSYIKGNTLVNGCIPFKGVCDDCTEVADYKASYHPDALFNTMVVSHGLATGYGTAEKKFKLNSIENAVDKLLGVHEGEICCSHKSQRIGAFGVYCQGRNTLVSNRDVWSRLNDAGERVFCIDKYEDYIVLDREDYRLDLWDHTEHFVIPERIVGFWVKDWALESIEGLRGYWNSLKEEFQKRGCVFHVVKRRT